MYCTIFCSIFCNYKKQNQNFNFLALKNNSLKSLEWKTDAQKCMAMELNLNSNFLENKDSYVGQQYKYQSKNQIRYIMNCHIFGPFKLRNNSPGR